MALNFAYPIIYVSDMGLACAFYRTALGYSGSDSDDTFVELRLGERLIALNSTANDPTKTPGSQTLLFTSDEIDADHMRMSHSGIALSRIEQSSYGRTYFLTDPDGNKIEVVESVQVPNEDM